MNRPVSSRNIHYKDTLLWAAGYPIAALSFIFLANDNSLTTLIRLPTFLSDILFALVVTFAAGVYIRRITRILDARIPWHDGFRRRLLYQFLLGILVPLTVSMLLEVVYLYSARIPLASSSIVNLELPLAFIFLLLANLFYLVNYLFYQKRTEIITITREVVVAPKEPVRYLTVQKGFTEEKIGIENCALLVSRNKLLWLHTYSGEQFRLAGSLEEWESKLKEVDFYRVNRQYLAARLAIQSVEQTETRKLKINFVIPSGEVYVSKPNAASFRQWWKKGCPS
ncbi:MAG TPA: LytTR family DNA-binding domain-containing protein [Ferruginibacter sp.]|jgi:hypothetical protein|nr:LytTR family transcriptional regulator DNA-binding domain-containing protein [Chitinophagales bacterium]HMU71231.1 LytTR family DNA-binding domain-containing protein [Ferruginibacter sp.]HMX35737.1 LytTR family DNA-binding domain-containing protein [Ferruginibacter sp.]HMX79194.1 LytTR family DNA-binding domain-containing protein [Ferruginibacter sp.]HNA01540.1 LytTR family DNA-binding domain-containing protein [Ferruginibacter sp.]